MTELQRLADQHHRIFTGDAWHGPALREILKDVTAKQAAAHPVAGAHSIWELVLHIAAWVAIVDAAIHGKPLPSHSAKNIKQLDWPPVRKTDAAAWRQAQQQVYAAAEMLRRSIRGFNPKRLREKVPGRNYDFGYALPGIVQHTLYHAGQIALLKKAMKIG